MTEKTYVCPECGSDRVTLEERTMWMANTGELWCHRVKEHDHDAVADCLDCDWQGIHSDLTRTQQPNGEAAHG